MAKYGVGLDNIDLAACAARGVKVSRTVGANSNAVADYALTLMLAVARKAALIDRRCRERDWGKITGIDLYGKTLGIVGLGAIGKCVARRARGFEMKILAHDVTWDEDFAREAGIERADPDRICREADFISLHTVLNDETRNLINARRLGMMKKTAVLINTARGGLIDETALLAALREAAFTARDWMFSSRSRPRNRPGTAGQSGHGFALLLVHGRGHRADGAHGSGPICCGIWICAEAR